VGAAASVWVAYRTRLGGLDQSVHNKRLESYPQLVKAAAPLAIYFPTGDAGPWALGFPARDAASWALSLADCRAIGRAMSKWYFGGGGLLLSTEARDAYFLLARALTRATAASSLRVPTFPRDAQIISVEKLDEYREKLAGEYRARLADKYRAKPAHEYEAALAKKEILDDVEHWDFGCSMPETDPPAHNRFQDYVFLQRLSSELRSALAEDLRSRRRPS
jgi:hypothetical protein